MRHSQTSRSRSLLSFESLGLPAALVVVVGVSALAGCSPDKGPGSLSVTYELGNQKSCAELGIDSLRAELVQGPSEDLTVVYSEEIPCEDGGEIVLDLLEPGLYSLIVSAQDDNGVETMDNLGQPDTERRVEIFEAAQANVAAELTARPAQFELRWRLGADGFGNCAAIGIDRFEVTAYQNNGTVVLLETELDCDLAGDAMGYRLVPDPDRELNGALLDEVGIQAVDASGNSVGSAATISFEPVGAGYPLQLTVECTESGCVEQA
ncbi:hypothetical protein ENSA5_37750 [Enhygromyxa salina]|uniref:Uncharacterized protein n=1 Tax=Enhygromyxa salina TaxID=215803 RepID=A0A2S9XRZ8_9BACT|nr:hypothetical protein [Enhygromyxa salina]PRP95642.1 hypothetical protein ENSA5_37750 [Enhygromyxa salina]